MPCGVVEYYGKMECFGKIFTPETHDDCSSKCKCFYIKSTKMFHQNRIPAPDLEMQLQNVIRNLFFETVRAT